MRSILKDLKKYKINKFKIGIVVLSIIIFILRIIFSNNPNLTELIYSKGFYRVISLTGNKVTGILPFSLAELLALTLIVLIIVMIIRFILKVKNKKEERKEILIKALVNVLLIVLVFYSWFNLAWGFNYERRDAFDIFHLEKQEFDIDLLNEMILEYSNEATLLREEVKKNKEGIFTLNDDLNSSIKRANKGYEIVGKIYPELSGNYSNPKKILLSGIYSYTGIWGVYSPFTFEANINTKVPEPYILATIMHEMSHLRGIANEDEANYIAYLTCRYHPDSDYKYSGLLLALRYSLSSLRRNDRELYNKTYKKLDANLKKDLDTRYEFSEKYEGLFDDISSEINNLFLKSNGVKSGIQSYGKVVDLLISDYARK